MHRRLSPAMILAPAVFIGSLVFLVGGIRVGGGGDDPPFFIDEAHKLAETYYWHLFFERRDVHHPAWSKDFYARTNPPVAKYIFGAALALGGYHVHDQQLQEDFDRYWRESPLLRTKVPDGMLRISRWTSAVFGSLVCMVLFMIGHRTGGVVTGLIAWGLLITHSAFQYHVRVGLTDSILLFFMVLIVPATMAAVRTLLPWVLGDPAGHDMRLNPGTGRRCSRGWVRLCLHTAVVPGLITGLAAGTKLTGALAGVAYAAGLAAGVLRAAGGRRWVRGLGICLLGTVPAMVLATGVFVGINPTYYTHPLTRAIETMHLCRDWTVKQQLDPGGGLFDLQQKLAAVGHFTLRSGTLPMSQWVGTIGIWLTVWGFTVGVAVLVLRAVCGGPTGDDPSSSHPAHDDRTVRAGVVLLWVITCIAGIALWLPLVWRRYLLFPYVPICLTTALGWVNSPRVFRRVVDALTRGAPRAERRSAVGEFAVVAVAWYVLTMTSWVIAPELLDPSTAPAVDSHRQEEWYRSALRGGRSDSPALYRNYALVLMRLNRPKEAAAHLQKALDLLARRAGDGAAVTVQRGRVLYDLTRAKLDMGDRLGAMETFGQYVVAVRTLRDTTRSNDPKVRSEYDRTIAEQERWMAWQSRLRPAAPMRSSPVPGVSERS